MQFQRAHDEGEVAEGLRRVAQLPAGLDAPLLAEEPDVVAQRQQALEQLPGLVAPASPDQGLDQPEGAGQEHPLLAGQPVIALCRQVAAQEAVVRQLALDRVDGSDDARIIRREEPHPGQQQEARIQLRPPVGLHERVALGVEPVGHDLGVDGVTQLLPTVRRAGQAEVPDALDHAVRRHPGHHLGVREVASRAAHFPQPVVRLAPGRLQDVP